MSRDRQQIDNSLSRLLRSVADDIERYPKGTNPRHKPTKESVSEDVRRFWDMPAGGPKSWGRVEWAALYHELNALPDVLTADQMMDLITALLIRARFLPCPMCRTHFKNNIKKIEVDKPEAYTRAYLLKWLSDTEQSTKNQNRPAAERAAELQHRMVQEIPMLNARGEIRSEGTPSNTNTDPDAAQKKSSALINHDNRWVLLVAAVLLLLAAVALVGMLVAYVHRAPPHKRGNVPSRSGKVPTV